MKLHTDLILASRSPRRRKLLHQLGLRFHVDASEVEEIIEEGIPPAQIVQDLAAQKAAAIAPRHPEALTLAADTIVVHQGNILGKPQDEAEACAMLERLSEATHTVYTGIALLHPPTDRRVTAHEATQVTFASLTDAEIKAYVASGSPMDKAGAYGIQDDWGAVLVARIDGDYYNVVGLPLHLLYTTLKTSFADLLVHVPQTTHA